MRVCLLLAWVFVAACGGDSKKTDVDAAIDAPTVDAPAPPVIDLDTKLRACAVAGACGLVADINQCVFLLDAYATPERIQCLASSSTTDCAAARACFGYRVTADATCTPGSSCLDGDTYTRCVNGFRSEQDCPASMYQLGDACITNGRSDCGGAACANSGEATCNGSVSISCDSGITEVTDCADRGLICNSATGLCAGTAAGSCTPGTASTCEGDTIVKCDAAGVSRRQDCSVMGRTCVMGSSDKICGYGNACNASTELPTCNGTTLNACIDGVRKSFDCTTIGATRCTGSGTRDARCLP